MAVWTRFVTAALVAGVLAGCGGDGAPAAAPDGPVVLRAASLRAGEALPAASGPPLLTVSGAVRRTNGAGALVLDRALLDRLTQVRLRTYEPWVKKDLTFRGVWLADVLALAGAAPGAGVRVVALDDYEVTLSAADLATGAVLLATADGDGGALPVDQGGPTRIVFRAGSRAGANPDQWIWSLRTLVVR